MKFKHKRFLLRFFLILIIIFFLIWIFYFLPIEKAQSLCPSSDISSNVKNVQKAIDLYSSAQLFYQEPFVFEQKGLLLYQNSNYKDAYEQFIQAIEFKDRFPLYEKVVSFISFGLFQPTDWEIKQILLYYTLGDISTKLGDYKQCVIDYTDMIEIAKEKGRDSLEKEKRAFCYYKLGMYKEAYKDCVDEKEFLNNKIKLLSDNKLKSAYLNRIKKIDNLLIDISNAQGIN